MTASTGVPGPGGTDDLGGVDGDKGPGPGSTDNLGGADGDEGPGPGGTGGLAGADVDEGPGPGGTDGGGGETGPLDVVNGRFDLLLPLNCARRHRAVL